MSAACARSTALTSARTASRSLGPSGFRFGGAGASSDRRASDRRQQDDKDDTTAAHGEPPTSADSDPAYTWLLGGGFLERQRFDGGERVMRRQIGMQRRHRDVAVAHRLIVRPIVRLPLVLAFLDPVVRVPLRIVALGRPTSRDSASPARSHDSPSAPLSAR